MDEELQNAAIAFLNAAPLEGDYALLLLSLTGTRHPLHTPMIQEYAEARKRLVNALKSRMQTGDNDNNQSD